MTLETYTFAWAFTFFQCLTLFHGAWGICGPPPKIPNTEPVLETSVTPGQTVDYVCDRNTGYYETPGKSKTTTCQDDGSWTQLDEFCTKGCPIPERLSSAEPDSDALENNIFIPGTRLSYRCRPGYTRQPGSKSSRICLDSYTWSSPEIVCQRKLCGNPGEVDNGEMEATDFLFGSRVTYTCNEGYSLLSSRNYRDCLADGTWSNSLPQCDVVICPPPHLPDNVEYSPVKDEYSYSDAVTLSCKKPFELVGSPSISCTATGEWSPITSACKAVNCPDPVVENSIRTSGFIGPYTLNSAIVFSCNANFAIRGSSSISCNSDSQWDPEIPKCETTCGSPPSFDFAKLDDASAGLSIYYNGTEVNYTCKPGFERSHDKKYSLTCNERTWSQYPVFCTRISCGPPGDIKFGSVAFKNTHFGSKATYTCHRGYGRNISRDHRECQANGKWSEPIGCKAIEDPTKDDESKGDLSVGEKVGIGFGVCGTLVGLGALLAMYLHKKKKSGDYDCDVKQDKSSVNQVL